MTVRPPKLARGARHRVERSRERAQYDRDAVYAILDEGFIAHVGFAHGSQPFVIPMLYARLGERVLLHGSVASRLVNALAGGVECCVSVTHLDGLVLARSHFHHSVNYRSVVLFGKAVAITDPDEKAAALTHFVDALLPGRSADSRPPDTAESAATTVLSMEIVDASAKVRAGGPKDHPDDVGLPVWAGVLPLAVTRGAPIPAADMADPPPLPDYLARRAT
jgi:nitroimidazol reductase NimA-like FMN-containing flavoprotein (pyridoxamine 5'-phosphate oxidase superfamily)